MAERAEVWAHYLAHPARVAMNEAALRPGGPPKRKAPKSAAERSRSALAAVRGARG